MSAGFWQYRCASEIDPRQGNLWVVSGGDGTSAADPPARTTLAQTAVDIRRVLESFGP
jgi:hypothetical protein